MNTGGTHQTTRSPNRRPPLSHVEQGRRGSNDIQIQTSHSQLALVRPVPVLGNIITNYPGENHDCDDEELHIVSSNDPSLHPQFPITSRSDFRMNNRSNNNRDLFSNCTSLKDLQRSSASFKNHSSRQSEVSFRTSKFSVSSQIPNNIVIRRPQSPSRELTNNFYHTNEETKEFQKSLAENIQLKKKMMHRSLKRRDADDENVADSDEDLIKSIEDEAHLKEAHFMLNNQRLPKIDENSREGEHTFSKDQIQEAMLPLAQNTNPLWNLPVNTFTLGSENSNQVLTSENLKAMLSSLNKQLNMSSQPSMFNCKAPLCLQNPGLTNDSSNNVYLQGLTQQQQWNLHLNQLNMQSGSRMMNSSQGMTLQS